MTLLMAQAIEISALQVLDKQARPDGFEPPTTWFEVGSTEVRITEQNPDLTNFELCYVFPRYRLISLSMVRYAKFE